METNFNFDALLGKKYAFYGVCDCKFKLDKVIYEAMEDENDGYRSMLGCVIAKEPEDGIFFKSPIANVWLVYEESDCDDNYKLIDITDGHVWLRFGTDNTDDYYPYFVFEYSPKEPKK